MSARFIITNAKLHIFCNSKFLSYFFKIKSVWIKVQTSNWLYNSILHTVYQFIVSFFKKTAALKPTFMYIYKVHFKAMYRRRNTCNRKPCTHDNDGYRTSVTAAGKHNFPPFIVAPPFVSSRGALRHYIRPLFLFASPCMPTFPCRLQDGISMSFSLLGQR